MDYKRNRRGITNGQRQEKQRAGELIIHRKLALGCEGLGGTWEEGKKRQGNNYDIVAIVLWIGGIRSHPEVLSAYSGSPLRDHSWNAHGTTI